ncbi:MAG: hypothetical protein ACRC35_04995, partial [Angustibacter sp.]
MAHTESTETADYYTIRTHVRTYTRVWTDQPPPPEDQIEWSNTDWVKGTLGDVITGLDSAEARALALFAWEDVRGGDVVWCTVEDVDDRVVYTSEEFMVPTTEFAVAGELAWYRVLVGQDPNGTWRVAPERR